MNLERLLYEIAQYGIENKIINSSMASMSIYELNADNIKEYPVLFTAPTGAHSVHQNTTDFTITLYYLDRLTRDNENGINVLSTSIEQLKGLINGIKNIDGVVNVVEDYDIINFADTQGTSDNVAGAYATIKVTVINSESCEKDWAGYES